MYIADLMHFYFSPTPSLGQQRAEKGHVVVGVMVGSQPGERRSQPSSARAAHVTWSNFFLGRGFTISQAAQRAPQKTTDPVLAGSVRTRCPRTRNWCDRHTRA
jgi:hypothetical protein